MDFFSLELIYFDVSLKNLLVPIYTGTGTETKRQGKPGFPCERLVMSIDAAVRVASARDDLDLCSRQS